MTNAIEPARLALVAGAPPRATRYDDVYHSAGGGPDQARHVFLAGNGLPARWRGRQRFTIVETGFGLGLNFLATWSALRADPDAPQRLHYVAVEKHPPAGMDLERVHAAWPHCADIAVELRRHWPPLVAGFHRIEFERGRVALTLLFGDAAELLAESDAYADALYLDGFAPEKNPDMWSDAVIAELARLSTRGTTLATWTVAAAVRARLTQAGFDIDKRPGFGRKREMLVGVRGARATCRPAPRETPRHAAIVGAGLAGAWCADALARRGWRVEVIERHASAAAEASGNAVGALRPALNLADNVNARLARAAFLLARQRLATDPRLAATFDRSGILHIATSAAHAERMMRILATHAFPSQYAGWVERDAAADIAGQPVAGPGWWIPLGGAVEPPALCKALLDHERITTRFGCDVARVAANASGWQLHDARGTAISAAPLLILANSHAASALLADGGPRLVIVRGQVSHLPSRPDRRLSAVICGDGYVAPLPGGGYCVGATFDPDDTALDVRVADHAQNLARLERMLPGFAAGLMPHALRGRAALRTATADRVPMCGAIDGGTAPDTARHAVRLVTGLGARGLIWAPLCAEILASSLDGEPNPIERGLIAAMRPDR